MADAAQSKVDQPAKATKLLGATHVLSGIMRWDGGRMILRASLSDTHSQLPMKEWYAEYAAPDMRNAPVFLAGMVAGTLRLPSLGTSTGISAAAYSDFITGSGLLQRNDAARALPLLERAVKTDPSSPLTHAAVVKAQIILYQTTNDPIWLDRAIMSLASARRINPDEPEFLLASAMVHESLGEYETARDVVLRILEVEPQNADALRRLGRIYDESSRFGDALAAFQKAEHIQPGHIKNYLGLCYVYKHQGNYEDGAPQCQKVAATAPDSLVAHLALASAYGDWGHYPEAESESRTALNLDPASALALQILALALSYQGRYSEAIYYFQRAGEAGSPTHLLDLNLGTTYRWAGVPEKARESYREGIKLAEAELAKNSRDAAVRSDSAYMHAWLHEPEKAHADASVALEQAQGSTNIVRMLVMTYAALGENELAWQLTSNASKETVHRLTLEPDLAEFRRSPQFKRLMESLKLH